MSWLFKRVYRNALNYWGMDKFFIKNLKTCDCVVLGAHQSFVPYAMLVLYKCKKFCYLKFAYSHDDFPINMNRLDDKNFTDE